MDNELVSVIIPTRNRQEYAEKTVRQICSLGLDIQVIIQDNSDNDSLREMIKELIDAGAVDYSYDSDPLPFSENYNRAALKVRGKYICAIGDDDGILPNIIECAKWMETEGIDAVKPAKDLVYCYPGNINKKLNACVGFGRYTGEYRYANPEAGVISLLDDGGCNYLEKNLIGSYHGLVSMDLMNEVKRITGVYYGGLTPDMYSVVCLSLVPEAKLAIVDYPITLPGVCPSSGSAASETGKHVGKIEEAPHLKLLPDYKWDMRVPRYYSVETIWCETMIKAVCDMQREELIHKYYNQTSLAYYLYKHNKSNREEILKVLVPSLQEYVLNSFRKESKRDNAYRKANRAIIKLFRKRIVHRKINDIETAVKLVMKQLEKDGSNAPWEKREVK